MLLQVAITHIHKLIGNTRVANKCVVNTRPKIILGLSGGPDSVFLFHAFVALQKTGHVMLVAAHLDHEWRASAQDDAQFCAQLCATENIPLVSTKASALNLSIKFNGSHEDVGRRMRRAFFEQVRAQYGADFIALAHHRQDQQETFFLRIARGATLSGLTCMPALDGVYMRPLLGFDKKDIITYLYDHNLKFCIDPTNESSVYLRNRIRKSLLPVLMDVDARFDKKFDDTVGHLQEEDGYLQELALEHFEKIFKSRAFPPDTPLGGVLVGDLPAFKKLHPVMQRRVLMLWLIQEGVSFNPSTAFFEELLKFINNGSGGKHQVGGWEVCKRGKRIWIGHCVLPRA